jgi:hypothetical protein
MTFTYAVTAVSHDGGTVPLTAGRSYSMAHAIARPRSADAAWSAVEIREAGTGRICGTYSDGRPVAPVAR